MAEETPRNENTGSTELDLDLKSLSDLALGPRWSSGPVIDNIPRMNFREEREGRPQRQGGAMQKRDRRPPRRDAAPSADPARQAEPRQERPQGERPQGDRRPPRRDFAHQAPPPPPFRPIVQVSIYPEEGPFKLLGTAIKNSGRTYELFEIAKLILEKPERFVVVVHPLPESPVKTLFISQPDNMPFESEDAALKHVFSFNAANFFEIEEILVDPPKGNYLMVNRCGITGELLAPPNYHKYQQILQAHYTARCSNMPYERFLSRVEGVREKEAVEQWLEKMRKQTRYKLREPIEGVPSEFESLEAARFQLVLHAKEKLVRTVQNARFEGRLVETMPAGLIRQSIEAVIADQRRFPLDTANNLRGRLRRMGFSVYKKGSKGISYVCAIRRAFRKPGETFGESVQQLIEFIEAHPGFPATDLAKDYLGTVIPEAGEAALSPEDAERLKMLRNDLRWLITSGYVTEYSNGRLFAPPPQEGAAQSDDEVDARDVPGVTTPIVEESAAPAPAEAAQESVAEAPAEAAPEEAPKAE